MKSPLDSPSRQNATFIPLEAVQSAGRGMDCATPSSPEPMFGFDELGPSTVAVMITRRCNMSCAHCSVESGPKVKGEPTREELLQWIDGIAKSGARNVLITGGEAMLRPHIVLELMTECTRLGMGVAMTSNGFWGKDAKKCDDTLRDLNKAGMEFLTISYDRYHAEFQGHEPVLNIARAARKHGVTLRVSVTRTAQDADMDAIVAPFDAFPDVQLRFYDVQPLGRARDLPAESLRGETRGFCNACFSLAVTDDGRVMACNGPSYFSKPTSPLFIGSLEQESFETLALRHKTDTILETIRTFGPSRLLSELEKMPDYEGFARPSYSGMCDLCLHLNSDEGAVAALTTHLSQPRYVAERMAAKQVFEGARRVELSLNQVNGIGANRIILKAARQSAEQWAEDAERILGRADLDWHHLAFHVAQCGLAGPLQNALHSPALRRWAPQFFAERLHQQAMHDGIEVLQQREAMRRLSDALGQLGARGILLKGSAMAAIEADGEGDAAIGRASCDVDIYIAPDKAALVWKKLQEMGFKDVTGAGDKSETAHRHQLEPLTFDGMLIEIHQSLLPPYCGLPEKEMLASAIPLQNEKWRQLSTLSGEGMLLHTVMHGSKHLLSHYLKTSWDIEWIIDRFPELDWPKVACWGDKSGMRRGFWVPIAILSRKMELSVPDSFLSKKPNDRKQRRLELFAVRHLLNAQRFAYDENPWVRRGLQLLMCDSTLHRTKVLGGFLFGRSSREFRQKKGAHNPEHPHLKLGKLVKVWKIWRQVS